MTETIDLGGVRRIAVAAQKLDGRPARVGRAAIASTARDINCIQLDPTPVVARNQYLILWSRLGNYDRKLLDRACWNDRTMFEYWAHAASLVMTEDWPLFVPMMRAYRRGTENRHIKVRSWIAGNRKLRDRIMRDIKRDGPLPSRYFTDLGKETWGAGEFYEGWNQGRHVGRMLDCLWTQGHIMVSRREGATRYWDLTERVIPDLDEREQLSDGEAKLRSTEHSLRSLGIGTERHIGSHFIRRYSWKVGPELRQLEDKGIAHQVPVGRDGTMLPGPWWVHRDYLPLLERTTSEPDRTTLLSPFDNLICDRARTELLWDFYFRIEIYVPKPKRQYGYFVMPILYGDSLVGRADVAADRDAGALRAKVYAENKAPAAAGVGVASALEDLAGFCNVGSVEVSKDVPRRWSKALKA